MKSDRMRTLLVIDDDRILGEALKDGISGPTQEVLLAPTAAEGLFLCRNHKIDIVLLDQNLPDGQGLDLCPQILEFCDQCKIIFITAFPDFSKAVQAIKLGAYDYLSKPFELEALLLVISRAAKTLNLERVGEVEQYKSSKDSADSILIGNDSALAEVNRMIDLASREEAPVLITGETGTGKNVVAKAIHYRGGFDAPFVSINCASLPENLIEAELFGYEKGAFTGATGAKQGLFEIAEGGSIFLDEIGEIPLHLQAKLLGVLEDQNIRRLGSTVSRPVAVRIIAATNLELDTAIRQKTFREDLFYRLNVIHIDLPPLRARLDDLADLCQHFVRRAARGRSIELPAQEIQALQNYHWPGNVRELKNIIERAIILQQQGTIYPSRLIGETNSVAGALPQAVRTGEVQTLEDMEKKHIRFALAQHGFNLTQTAKALQIGLSTLKRKVKLFKLTESNGSK